MEAQRVAIDWEGLERALTRRSRESEAFLDTRTGDIVWVTRGWSDDHGFSDPELDEGLAARRLVPVLPVPPQTEHGWMQAFVESLEDGWPKDMLTAALEGPAPDLLDRLPRRAPRRRPARLARGQRRRAGRRAPAKVPLRPPARPACRPSCPSASIPWTAIGPSH